MDNGIKRRTSVGVAAEDSYGVYTGTASSYVLQVMSYEINPIVNKIENEAMFGSTYGVNDAKIANKYCKVDITAKVDENVIPLLLKQKMSISSALVSGESAVYKHTLTYSNNNVASTGQSFALFLDDPDRQDYRITGARFSNFDFIGAQDNFFLIEMSGMAKFPVATGITNTIDFSAREFVGRNISFQMADYGDSLSSQLLASLSARHSFMLSENEDNILLGEEEPGRLFTKDDRFEAECVALFDNTDIRDVWAANTRQKSQITVSDSDRYVEGSVANTNPSLTFIYPVQHIIDWTKQGGANDIMKQQFRLLAIDDPSIATAPISIEIVNSVASY